MNARDTSNRIYPLTSLRFFAAAGIFIYHWQALGLKIPSFCAQGVSFFFVLSGFILTHAHRTISSPGRFYQRRAARIWPVHVLAFLIAVLFLSPSFSWTTAALNLLLLHAWIPVGALVFSFNAVSWSVSNELFFYLLFPAFMRLRRFRWVLVAVGGGTLLTVLAANRLWAPATDWESFSWYQLILQHPLLRLFEFVVGVGIGRYFVRTGGEPPRFVRAAPTACELGALLLVAVNLVITTYFNRLGRTDAGWWQGHGSGTYFSQSGSLPAFAVAILVFAYSRGAVSRLLSLPLLVLLGEISYSTYMLHQLVLAFAVKYSAVERWGLVWTIVGVVAVTYLASFLTWRWLEVPARRALAPAPRFGT